jgi:ATP-dependent Clp protease protease subunit
MSAEEAAAYGLVDKVLDNKKDFTPVVIEGGKTE